MALKQVLGALALLTIAGCDAGWTECDPLYVGAGNAGHVRYRVLETNPLTIQYTTVGGMKSTYTVALKPGEFVTCTPPYR